MSLIEAHGLYWREQDIYWGSGRNAGALLGVPAGNRTAPPIDFRDQSGLYVLYHGRELVYVGQAGAGNANLFSRLKQHRRDQLADRWDRFSWFGLQRVLRGGTLSKPTNRKGATSEMTLNQVEAVLIAVTEPGLNKQGGRFGSGRRYLQYRDERLGKTESEMIRELYRELEERRGGRR